MWTRPHFQQNFGDPFVKMRILTDTALRVCMVMNKANGTVCSLGSHALSELLKFSLVLTAYIKHENEHRNPNNHLGE